MDNGPDLKSGTFPCNGTQFCAVSAGSAVMFCDRAGSQSVVARINDLHPTDLELNVYVYD